MEASVNPSNRRLRPEKWEASPDRAGSSHIPAATPKARGGNDERKLIFSIETVVDDTPGEVAFVHTPLSIAMYNDEIQVRVNNNIVPLKEGNSPYTTVCEAIQYYVLSEIDNLRPDGTQKMVQLW